MALEGRLRRHGAAVWLSLIKPMLVCSPPPPPSIPTSAWDRPAPLQMSVTYSYDVRVRPCLIALDRGGRVTAADGQGNGGGPLNVAGLGLLSWLSCGTVSFIIILHWT